MEGSYIKAIGPPDLERVAGCDVIDARSAFVLPGLINAHTHLARGGMFSPNKAISVDQVVRNHRDLLAAGVTAVGEMGCAAGLVHSLHRHLERNSTCGPAISACGPLLSVKGGYPLDWLHRPVGRLGVVITCDSEPEARRAVNKVAEMQMTTWMNPAAVKRCRSIFEGFEVE